jgi:hypothetical protein
MVTPISPEVSKDMRASVDRRRGENKVIELAEKDSICMQPAGRRKTWLVLLACLRSWMTCSSYAYPLWLLPIVH